MPATAEIKRFLVPQPLQLDHGPELARAAAALRKAFDAAFTLWDGHTGELLHVSVQQPGSNDLFRGQLVRAIHGNEPRFIADEDCVLLLAVPFEGAAGRSIVATASFVVRSVDHREYLNGAATLLGLDQARAMAWITRQPVWQPDALVRLATAVQSQVRAESRAADLEREVDKLSNNLASTYEEICLLHGVTQNLRINSDEEHLCSLVLRWLLDCLPCQAAAIQLLPVAKQGQITYKARTSSELYAVGQCPLDNDSFTRLIESLHLEAGCGPFVANRVVTDEPDWPNPEIHELIVVPMAEGSRVLGWLTIINHTQPRGEFGTVEASLLNSIGAILGIHSSNRDLYRQQSEFLASVVRALTSAIDAKDPYTCGHSDRVARIAVRLAKEMNCESKMLHTIYMAGLLHDIGKIGIDDAVLRKPGKLTEAEFDHIKEHPELGYRILADIHQLADVLPAVLHHHEQWDGRGYPFKLVGDQIPLIARILAVADAFDAMNSDRPYRRGMPVERVEELFREGAAQQWDAEVIKAYFTAREDIQKISKEERANLTLDVQQWT
jgi:HD-GYP domain-containing protein (c-di-GMP phosphodiesterase class II)